MDDASRAAQGITVRREVLGDAHVDRVLAGSTAFSRDFQDLIARYAWGTSGPDPACPAPSAACSR